jgi:DNA polymerase III alpha subunit (gram-positive type)
MTLETYVSTDIESDGPIPGPNSMLSFASVAFDKGGKELGSFSRNLDLLPDATPDPNTMEWWATQGDAWAACRKDLVSPKKAMEDYIKWVKSLPGKPVFVAYPAGFDFTFMYQYLIRFAGTSPFSFSALDIKSYAMAKLGTPYRNTTKRRMPKEWFPKLPHTHVAEDDAREQGLLFIAMLKWDPNAKKSTPQT